MINLVQNRVNYVDFSSLPGLTGSQVYLLQFISQMTEDADNYQFPAITDVNNRYTTLQINTDGSLYLDPPGSWVCNIFVTPYISLTADRTYVTTELMYLAPACDINPVVSYGGGNSRGSAVVYQTVTCPAICETWNTPSAWNYDDALWNCS